MRPPEDDSTRAVAHRRIATRLDEPQGDKEMVRLLRRLEKQVTTQRPHTIADEREVDHFGSLMQGDGSVRGRISVGI